MVPDIADELRITWEQVAGMSEEEAVGSPSRQIYP